MHEKSSTEATRGPCDREDSFRPEVDGVTYWSHVEEFFGMRRERGIINLPAGTVVYYTQDGRDPLARPYSRLTCIEDGTVYTRTFEKPYRPRYLKTLARRWMAEREGC